MVDMTRSASVFRVRTEFDDFLFAPIDEDGNGTVLSVLSALTRLDLDPWQETAELARLPGERATQRLASLIAALPGRLSTHGDLGTIAARLIALLPRRAGANFPARATSRDADAAENSRAIIRVICFVIFMTFVLGAQWMFANHQPSAGVDNAHTPASSTVSPPMPVPNPGRTRGGGLG